MAKAPTKAKPKKAAQPGKYRVRIKERLTLRAGDLVPHPDNWRMHPPDQREALVGVLEEIGITDTLKVVKRGRKFQIVDGHLRADLDPDDLLLCDVLDLNEEEARFALATHDWVTSLAESDGARLADLMHGFEPTNEALRELFDDVWAGQEPSASGGAAPARPTLADRFVVPPFSVLDARQGYWRERKRDWLAMGIRSELGRGDNVLGHSDQTANINFYTHKRELERKLGRSLSTDEARDMLIAEGVILPAGKKNGLLGFSEQARSGYQGETASLKGGLTFGTTIAPYSAKKSKMKARPPHGPSVKQGADGSLVYGPTNSQDGTQSGTSIFDPVLCELAYRWFSPDGGSVLDPFAGGSVRGIVASALGRAYTGVDLSERQVVANREQAAVLVPEASPVWIVGDSSEVASLAPGEYDFVFSCPPYADLEVYSDDPRDLSTMDYADFLDAYRGIIEASVGLLRDDRFACFVVGDVRDRRGFYRNFVSATIEAFRLAGAHLYCEAILVTAAGSLPIRVMKQFTNSRKLGKTHQNVLVFVKGDPRVAATACGSPVTPGEDSDLVP